MSDFTEQQRFLPQIRVAQSTCMPLRLTAIITGLLSIMPVLTGCGDGGETGSNPRVTMAPGVRSLRVSQMGSSPRFLSLCLFRVLRQANHQINRVAACTKGPYPSTLHQPR